MIDERKFKDGEVAKVLDCSRVERGAEVVILGYSRSTSSYYCRSAAGRTEFFVKADQLMRGNADASSD